MSERTVGFSFPMASEFIQAHNIYLFTSCKISKKGLQPTAKQLHPLHLPVESTQPVMDDAWLLGNIFINRIVPRHFCPP